MAGSSLDEEGRALIERLGGRWTANGGTCRCPAHDDRNPSLSVRPGRSRLLLHCFAGCEPADILRALASDRLIEPGAPADGERRRTSGGGTTQAAAARLWDSARDVIGTPAEAYLAGRGFQAGSPELRFHPRTPHGPRPLTRFRPALVAAQCASAALRRDSGLPKASKPRSRCPHFLAYRAGRRSEPSGSL